MITYAFWTISKKFSISPKQFGPIKNQYYYHMRAIITRSWFETGLDYNPRILGPKIEEFPCLVHKLSVILTALLYKPHWKMG